MYVDLDIQKSHYRYIGLFSTCIGMQGSFENMQYMHVDIQKESQGIWGSVERVSVSRDLLRTYKICM